MIKSSYIISEKIKIKFSSQKMLNLGEMKFVWQLFFCHFMQIDVWFFPLSFVRMFSGVLYMDPKYIDKWAFKKLSYRAVLKVHFTIYTL